MSHANVYRHFASKACAARCASSSAGSATMSRGLWQPESPSGALRPPSVSRVVVSQADRCSSAARCSTIRSCSRRITRPHRRPEKSSSRIALATAQTSSHHQRRQRERRAQGRRSRCRGCRAARRDAVVHRPSSHHRDDRRPLRQRSRTRRAARDSANRRGPEIRRAVTRLAVTWRGGAIRRRWAQRDAQCCCNAFTGSSRAARRAGRMPNTSPLAMATPTADADAHGGAAKSSTGNARL